MELSGLRLYERNGESKGTWPVSVSENWQVTCRFERKDALEVNYADYA